MKYLYYNNLLGKIVLPKCFLSFKTLSLAQKLWKKLISIPGSGNQDTAHKQVWCTLPQEPWYLGNPFRTSESR